MTPIRKANYPYDCPLLLSKEDVIKFRDAKVSLAEIAAMVKEVKDMTTDNHHTLRGYNGDDGMVARMNRLEEQLNQAATTMLALKDVPGELANVKEKVDALKDVPEAISTWKRYPSLSWMVRHKFKEMAIITASVTALTILIGFPNYYVGERLQAVIELLITKWLRM
jgi:hypothetical protein